MESLTAWDIAAIATKLLAYGGSFLAAGSVFFLFANGVRAAPVRKPLNKLVTIAILVGIVGSILQFGVQSGRLMDEGLSGMMDPDMVELVSGAPLGTSVFIRTLGLAILLSIWLPSPIDSPLAAIGGVVVAASFSFVGHGTGDPRWLLSALVSFHLIAVSFWIGALYPLHRMAGRSTNIIEAGHLSHRFGQQAAIVVSLLIAVGVFLTWWIVGSISALLGSQYGWTLIFKLLLVASVLGLAAANKFRFVPAMLKGETSAANHLRQSIRWETLVIAIILLTTAVLTTVTSLPMAENSDQNGSGMENMDHGN